MILYMYTILHWNIIKNSFQSVRFFGSLNGLAPSNGNINVPNSHSIQETNIVKLHKDLLDNNFIITCFTERCFRFSSIYLRGFC